ncbi:MAG TPA: hypothetical protein VGK38_12795, partial [Prolixibacteraceae bacterium]
MEKKSLEIQYDNLVGLLRSERNDKGFWSGRLSSSALGTAVAIVALKINEDKSDYKLITNGLDWLVNQINIDGGFGDTPESKSNVSTSLLSYAAISYCCEGSEQSTKSLQSIESYLN